MKSRKQKLNLYSEEYKKYLNMDDDILEHLYWYCVDNKINLEKILDKASVEALNILSNQKVKQIKITLYEEPFKTERGRIGFAKNIYSPNAKNNHNYMKSQIKELKKKSKKVMKELKYLICTPTAINIEAYFPLPKVKKKNAFELPLFLTGILKMVRGADYDNIGKAYTDMLNDILIYDDRMVYKGSIHKKYAVLPKVVIDLKYYEKHDSVTLYESLINSSIIKEYIKEDKLKIEKI